MVTPKYVTELLGVMVVDGDMQRWGPFGARDWEKLRFGVIGTYRKTSI